MDAHLQYAQSDQPKVSVIIPYYNTAQYVGETLDSLFNQTYQDFEVILVNDGSPDTDQLEAILEPYRSRIVYLTQENRGSASASNTALRVSRGKYIARLDSDDLWDPEFLAFHVNALDADSTIDVIFPNALFFGDSINSGKKFTDVCPVEGEITFIRLLTQECYVFGGVLARRDSIMRAGMFDESLGSAEDLDLWLRILHQGGRIVYHDRILAYYRQRSDSHTSDPIWLSKNNLQLLDKVERTINLTSEEMDRLKKQRAEIYALLRLHEGKKAFFEGQTKAAIDGLSDANAHYKSSKLSFMLMLLRIAPRLLLRAYDLRDKFLFGTNTKF